MIVNDFSYSRFIDNKYNYHYTRTKATTDQYCPPPETHDQYEFLYVVNGKADFCIEGRVFPVISGSMLAIAPFSFHTVRVDLTYPYERVCFHFDKSIIPDYCEEKKNIFDVLENGTPGKYFPPELLAKTEIPQIIQKVEKILSSQKIQDTNLIISSIEIALAVKEIYPLAPQLPKILNEYVRKAIVYIGEHLLEPITLNDIADNVYLDRYYLCHLFKKELMTSPMEYVAKKRAMIAKTKIENGEKKKAVFRSCGYSSYSSFFYNYKKQDLEMKEEKLKKKYQEH